MEVAIVIIFSLLLLYQNVATDIKHHIIIVKPRHSSLRSENELKLETLDNILVGGIFL